MAARRVFQRSEFRAIAIVPAARLPKKNEMIAFGLKKDRSKMPYSAQATDSLRNQVWSDLQWVPCS